MRLQAICRPALPTTARGRLRAGPVRMADGRRDRGMAAEGTGTPASGGRNRRRGASGERAGPASSGGTALKDGELVAIVGRVRGVTAAAHRRRSALPYAAVDMIDFRPSSAAATSAGARSGASLMLTEIILALSISVQAPGDAPCDAVKLLIGLTLTLAAAWIAHDPRRGTRLVAISNAARAGLQIGSARDRRPSGSPPAHATSDSGGSATISR